MEQIEPNSMNNIKIVHVQMLAKSFLCEQNFYSIPLQWVKKMDECCLCRKDLSAGVAYKKRKKLHGESASVARTMLNEFCVLEIGAGLDDIIEVSDKSVFLCCQCDSLQQELQLLNISITTAIRSLHLNTTTADISDISAFDQSVCSA